MSDAKEPNPDQQKPDWRDKPVNEEGDKDIKEGGVAGARRDRGNPEQK